MNNKGKTEVAVGGTSFFTLLSILFIGLKLCGVITWSWWLVLLPIWIGFAVFVGVLVVLAVLISQIDSLK